MMIYEVIETIRWALTKPLQGFLYAIGVIAAIKLLM